jgi:hypothetical protein
MAPLIKLQFTKSNKIGTPVCVIGMKPDKGGGGGSFKVQVKA